MDAVVDGLDGKLYLDPEEAVLAELVQKRKPAAENVRA